MSLFLFLTSMPNSAQFLLAAFSLDTTLVPFENLMQSFVPPEVALVPQSIQ